MEIEFNSFLLGQLQCFAVEWSGRANVYAGQRETTRMTLQSDK